jgi:hypothetical protein
MKKIILLFFLMTSIANAGSLGDETKNLISKGYTVTDSGVLGGKTGMSYTYYVMFQNLESENPVVICEKYYDSKKANCYDL